MKPGWAFDHPPDEFGQPWVPPQSLNRAVFPRQFRFGQRGVDFVVAYLVKPHDRPALATFQLWHKVMQALPRIRRNGPITQRTNRIIHR